MNNYSSINKCTDSETLINMFYDEFNSKPATLSMPTCIKIADRIKKIKDEYNEDEELLFLELRNLYIMNINSLNQAMFALKFENITNTDPNFINNKVYLGYSVMAGKHDSVVKDYVSSNMIIDIFNNTFPNYNIDMEAEIHKTYNTKERLLEKGINKAILDVVSKFDPFLSDYILCNIGILKDVQDKIDYILENYDNYEVLNEEKRYTYLMEDVKDYCEKYDLDNDEMLLKLAAEYHIIDRIMLYSEEYNDYCKIKYIVASANRNDIDINYMNLKKMVEEYLNTRIITKKISETKLSKELLNKLDEFIIDYNDLDDDQKLNKSLELFRIVKDNEEFDRILKYIQNNLNNKGKKILKFNNKKEC